jgi:GR25 family glycosyltransferase involved in LPS biosynthesis
MNFNHDYFDAVYFLNLDARTDRWVSFINSTFFKQLNSSVPIFRFTAIDTSTQTKAVAYGSNCDIKVSPVGDTQKIYYTSAPGAYGCFLSHVAIWEDICDMSYDRVLILEDDVEVESLSAWLSSTDFNLYNPYDYVQLNCRNRHFYLDYVNGIPGYDTWTQENIKKIGKHSIIPDAKIHPQARTHMVGTEAYILNSLSARCFLDYLYDSSALQDINTDAGSSYPYKTTGYNSEEWLIKNSIKCSVDKYIGYLALMKCFVRGTMHPVVSMSKLYNKSDILGEGGVPFWKMRKHEVASVFQSSEYGWWDYEES